MYHHSHSGNTIYFIMPIVIVNSIHSCSWTNTEQVCTGVIIYIY